MWPWMPMPSSPIPGPSPAASACSPGVSDYENFSRNGPIIKNKYLFHFSSLLGKGKMQTFWLTGKNEQESVRGSLKTRRRMLVPQISFSGTKDELFENPEDEKEHTMVIRK